MSNPANSLKIFGKNVRERRRACGLTQERLSELCELDPTYISMIEAGRRSPSFPTLLHLARALKCSVSALMENV